ncbi:hypothetical protein BGZ65_001663 [Modicella reniformis]|uniref:Uncharacterized protein n=1 Tax=Modicella reniformis TaxID=1440133 RepID=A0A9P6IM02_9FUNG|nr:hypothetical protein BGZ65_001663 [Modicella reniformis]
MSFDCRPKTPAPSFSTGVLVSTRQHLLQQHLDQPCKELKPICTTILPVVNNDDDLPTSASTVINDHISLETAGTGSTQGSLSSQELLSSVYKQNDYSAISKEAAALANPSSRPRDGDSAASNDPSPSPDQEGRHPQRLQGSWYTWLFRLERPETRSSVIVGSNWLPTGGLFTIRMLLFVYTFTVLITDLCRTERPQYEFCYLTQLSYLGLTSYLGTVSWHTFSEWRHQRLKHQPQGAEDVLAQSEAQWQTQVRTKTTLERQHWLLTDMNFFLYHTICTFHIILPLLYWGYLAYEGGARTMAVEMSAEALWRNYSFHGGDLIVVLIEIVINTMPFIPSHIFIVYLVSLLYLAEAHIVYRVDGFWIYPFLDTTQGPIWVVLYIGVGFVILCTFFFMYYFHRIMNWVYARSTAATTRRQDRNVAEEASWQYQQQDQNKEEQGTPWSMSSTSFYCDIESDFNPSTSSAPTPTPFPESTYYMYKHRQISALQTQNRKRSFSNSSEESTASTLVGSSDERGSRKITKKPSLLSGLNISSTVESESEQQQVQQPTPSTSAATTISAALQNEGSVAHVERLYRVEEIIETENEEL